MSHALELSQPFAALEHKKAKKKKEKSEREKRKKDKKDTLELEKAIFDQPQLSLSSWADCDDEEDLWAPQQNSRSQQVAANGAGKQQDPEPDSDHEIIDLEEEFGVELGKDEDHEPVEETSGNDKDGKQAEHPVPKPKRILSAPIPERTLSKKELKKKEMEDLDAVLAEFGFEAGLGESEESKGSKKKKKRVPKASSEVLDASVNECTQEEPSDTTAVSQPPMPSEEEAVNPNPEDEDEEPENGEIDLEGFKARLAKKKSSGKKSIAASLAAAEAKARGKKKGSKKDKTKFNQAVCRKRTIRQERIVGLVVGQDCFGSTLTFTSIYLLKPGTVD